MMNQDISSSDEKFNKRLGGIDQPSSSPYAIDATVPTHAYCLCCFDLRYMGDLLNIYKILGKSPMYPKSKQLRQYAWVGTVAPIVHSQFINQRHTSEIFSYAFCTFRTQDFADCNVT